MKDDLELPKVRDILVCLEELLWTAVSDDYASTISHKILDDVYQDVCECADPDDWNADDVRLAIGRVLLRKLGEDA